MSKPFKRVIVGAGAMFDRAALYETWAEAHSLRPTDKPRPEYAGDYRGRRTELSSGLVGTSLPTSPELLFRIALDGIPATTRLERDEAPPPPDARSLRALLPILDVDGIRDVVVTRAFVCLRFDPFVTTSVFDAALEVFEEALTALASLQRGSPYR